MRSFFLLLLLAAAGPGWAQTRLEDFHTDFVLYNKRVALEQDLRERIVAKHWNSRGIRMRPRFSARRMPATAPKTAMLMCTYATRAMRAVADFGKDHANGGDYRSCQAVYEAYTVVPALWYF
jgi:hypothetical protein